MPQMDLDLINEIGFERIYKVASATKPNTFYIVDSNIGASLSTDDKAKLSYIVLFKKNKSLYTLLHSKTIHFNKVNIDDQEPISSNKPNYNTVEYSNKIENVNY
ncbi:hypothetical protein C2G38_2178452 [Gigaspora rosea]|uniref:Uncharacterized protein n=1 Tax=Gigaspora rosea TaxID=44941 RepID=A0A397VHI5_9GLOM|nr:hypothetical protein C2G38_2178452 [Gigaspora rosea]